VAAAAQQRQRLGHLVAGINVQDRVQQRRGLDAGQGGQHDAERVDRQPGLIRGIAGGRLSLVGEPTPRVGAESRLPGPFPPGRCRLGADPAGERQGGGALLPVGRFGQGEQFPDRGVGGPRVQPRPGHGLRDRGRYLTDHGHHRGRVGVWRRGGPQHSLGGQFPARPEPPGQLAGPRQRGGLDRGVGQVGGDNSRRRRHHVRQRY